MTVKVGIEGVSKIEKCTANTFKVDELLAPEEVLELVKQLNTASTIPGYGVAKRPYLQKGSLSYSELMEFKRKVDHNIVSNLLPEILKESISTICSNLNLDVSVNKEIPRGTKEEFLKHIRENYIQRVIDTDYYWNQLLKLLLDTKTSEGLWMDNYFVTKNGYGSSFVFPKNTNLVQWWSLHKGYSDVEWTSKGASKNVIDLRASDDQNINTITSIITKSKGTDNFYVAPVARSIELKDYKGRSIRVTNRMAEYEAMGFKRSNTLFDTFRDGVTGQFKPTNEEVGKLILITPGPVGLGKNVTYADFSRLVAGVSVRMISDSSNGILGVIEPKPCNDGITALFQMFIDKNKEFYAYLLNR